MVANVLWFTGLSGSGKTSIALGACEKLSKYGKTVKILDGDEIRESLHKDLGFTTKDIELNNEKIALLCKKNINNYDFIMVPIISPFTRNRELADQLIGPTYSEIYVKASLPTVIQRDVKVLYNKALNYEIDNFIGIDPSTPYEPPENPDLTLNTDIETIGESIAKLFDFSISKGNTE